MTLKSPGHILQKFQQEVVGRTPNGGYSRGGLSQGDLHMCRHSGSFSVDPESFRVKEGKVEISEM